MNYRRLEHRRTYIMFLLAIMLFLVLCSSKVSASTTTLRVDPPSTNVPSGDTFNVNITVSDVANLTGWEFKLFYLHGIVNCTGITEGPFLKSAGGTFRVFNITNNYNATHGRVLAGCALLGLKVSANGSGVLATVTFKARSGGDTPLDLTETDLLDEKIPPGHIAHSVVDGTVHVAGPAANYDIAVTNVTCLKRIVGRGYPNNVTATLQNQGDLEVTFDVTIRANATAVGTKQVTLANGNTASVIFLWNTTGSSYGNYTLSAYATPLPGEIDTSDNTLVDGIVVITITGDLNGDGTVDIYDAITLANAYNTSPATPNWNANADINGDNIVDIYDAILLASHYNEKIP